MVVHATKLNDIFISGSWAKQQDSTVTTWSLCLFCSVAPHEVRVSILVRVRQTLKCGLKNPKGCRSCWDAHTHVSFTHHMLSRWRSHQLNWTARPPRTNWGRFTRQIARSKNIGLRNDPSKKWSIFCRSGSTATTTATPAQTLQKRKNYQNVKKKRQNRRKMSTNINTHTCTRVRGVVRGHRRRPEYCRRFVVQD